MAKVTQNIFSLPRAMDRVMRNWFYSPNMNVVGIPLPLVFGLPPVETANLSAPMSSLNMVMKELGEMTGISLTKIKEWFGIPTILDKPSDMEFAGPREATSLLAKIFNSRSAALAKASRELAQWADVIRNEMFPILEITPCVPKAVGGTNIFKLEEAWELYFKILNFMSFRLIDKNIRVAIQAESFPSETFTNDYGESFLERFTSIATSGAAELGYMTGSRDFSSLIDQLEGMLPSGVADHLKRIRGQISSGAQTAKSNNLISKNMADAAQLLSKMSVGSRIDFPNVWKNSAFSPSWSFTVRLYNPNPMDEVSTTFYIIGPLAALMSLALPITEDGVTYSWPFLLKCRIPGYLDGMATYIQSMTIIKGGDQQQIAQNQRLGIVDIRFELGCLYDTMLVTTGKIDNSDRPTLKKYLAVLAEEKSGLLRRPKDFIDQLGRTGSQVRQLERQLEIFTKYGWNQIKSIFDKSYTDTKEKP